MFASKCARELIVCCLGFCNAHTAVHCFVALKLVTIQHLSPGRRLERDATPGHHPRDVDLDAAALTETQ